jgi:hypothetical protein
MSTDLAPPQETPIAKFRRTIETLQTLTDAEIIERIRDIHSRIGYQFVLRGALVWEMRNRFEGRAEVGRSTTIMMDELAKTLGVSRPTLYDDVHIYEVFIAKSDDKLIEQCVNDIATVNREFYTIALQVGHPEKARELMREIHQARAHNPLFSPADAKGLLPPPEPSAPKSTTPKAPATPLPPPTMQAPVTTAGAEVSTLRSAAVDSGLEDFFSDKPASSNDQSELPVDGEDGDNPDRFDVEIRHVVTHMATHFRKTPTEILAALIVQLGRETPGSTYVQMPTEIAKLLGDIRDLAFERGARPFDGVNTEGEVVGVLANLWWSSTQRLVAEEKERKARKLAEVNGAVAAV